MANAAPTKTPVELLRKNFLDKAILRSQTLPRQPYVKGGQVQFTFPHAGYGSFAIVDFQGTLTVAGAGGTQAFSDKAPFSLFDKVSFDDYLGINRISASGHQLHEILVTRKWGFDENNSNLAAAYAANRFTSGMGAAGGAAGTYNLNFSNVVPISLHEHTTEGSFPFTIPNGDNTLTINFANETGPNNDSVIKTTAAGFTNTIAGTVGVTYYYWDVPAGTPLPVDDFSLVHEIRAVKDTTGITAGNEKRYMLRTGRTYYQVLQNLRVNDAPDTTDVANVGFYVDGSTPTLLETQMAYLTRTFNKYNRDLQPGMFVWDMFHKPWTPNDYGSLETSLNISSGANIPNGSNTYVTVTTEALYRTNKILADLATLPGGQQA